MSDDDPVVTIEALPYGKRPAAALEDSFLSFCASLDALSFDRIRARLQGCGALTKGWASAVDMKRPKAATPQCEPEEEWLTKLRWDDKGAPAATPFNAGSILRNWPPFESLRLNQLSLEAELDGQPMREEASFRWREQIEATFGVVFSSDLFDGAVAAVAEERAYHPFRDWLDALPPWDKKDRFAELAHVIWGSKDPMAPRFVECFLVGACARTYGPGEKNDLILTLMSPEHGTGKTESFHALFRSLTYIGDIDPSDKDCVMNYATSVCVIIDEADDFTRRSSWPAVKRMISQKFDTFRAPYHRRPRKWLRQFVFGATTNRDDFLHDETGSRRWLIIELSKMEAVVRVRMIESILVQLWAQARYVWAEATNEGRDKPRDYSFWLTPEEEEKRKKGAARFEDRGVIDEKIEEHLRLYDADGTGEIKMSSLLMQALGVDPEDVTKEKGRERAAGAVLRRLGYLPAESETSRARVWKKSK